MDGIEHIITGIAIAAFLAYSNKKSSYNVEKNKAGSYHLRMNKSYMWIGALGTIFGLIISIGILIESEEGTLLSAFMVFMMFSGLGVTILMWYYNHQLVFDEETIQVKSWTGKTLEINWGEIRKIKFSPIMGYLRIHSKSKKLNIHQHLMGLVEFIKMMENKTDYKAIDLKLPFN